MDPREIIFCLFLLFLTVAEAIKCKCTKESETVTCYDGVCEMEGGSCLMLSHPTMGVHYTCHTKGLKDGSCRNKTSKSGAPVRICGCEATDFCNYSYWPDRPDRSTTMRKTHNADKDVNHASAFTATGISLILTAFFALR